MLDAQRLKSLQGENAKLQKLLANFMPEIGAMREVRRERSRRSGQAQVRKAAAARLDQLGLYGERVGRGLRG